MKVAIAKPEQVGNDWTPLVTDFLLPSEIRRKISEILISEETSGGFEFRIVTMNRTVLDLARPEGPSICYDDVFVWSDDGLVPLLTLHTEDWLCHFQLGDLFDRGDLP
jgi:hypothetical protein